MRKIFLSTLFAMLLAIISLNGQTTALSAQEEAHGHTHYPTMGVIDAHKLIFPSKVPDRIIVSLTEDPSHSVAVNWRTDQQVDQGFVEVAKDSHGPDFLMPGNRRRINASTQWFENENTRDAEPLVKAAYHAALIDGLEPGTTYVYRVGDGSDDDSTWSEWFQLQTPTEDVSAPYSFIYFGDAQNNVKSMWSRVVRKSYQMMPTVEFMLHAGDLINHSESNVEWGEWFYAGGHIHASVPSVMTPGNHEYANDQLSALWRPQFNLPKNGPDALTQETCYAVDYKNLKLVSLDAVSLENNENSRQAQVQWLDSVLANNTKKWTVLTMHYPIYSTAVGRDNVALRESVLPLINKYGVDLVLQGHDHTYARGTVTNQADGITLSKDAGTVFAVSVSGPKMYESQNQAWMHRRGEFTQLFQIITVGNTSISYGAYTPLGSLYDGFELTKDKKGRKKLTNLKTALPERLKKDLLKEK